MRADRATGDIFDNLLPEQLLHLICFSAFPVFGGKKKKKSTSEPKTKSVISPVSEIVPSFWNPIT